LDFTFLTVFLAGDFLLGLFDFLLGDLDLDFLAGLFDLTFRTVFLAGLFDLDFLLGDLDLDFLAGLFDLTFRTVFLAGLFFDFLLGDLDLDLAFRTRLAGLLVVLAIRSAATAFFRPRLTGVFLAGLLELTFLVLLRAGLFDLTLRVFLLGDLDLDLDFKRRAGLADLALRVFRAGLFDLVRRAGLADLRRRIVFLGDAFLALVFRAGLKTSWLLPIVSLRGETRAVDLFLLVTGDFDFLDFDLLGDFDLLDGERDVAIGDFVFLIGEIIRGELFENFLGDLVSPLVKDLGGVRTPIVGTWSWFSGMLMGGP